MTYVRTQSEKYGFKVIEKPINTESGEELALYFYREKELVLIVVVFKKEVHWVDVLEEGISINGVVVGNDLYGYHKKKLKITFYGHRDCSLDDIVCIIDGVKALIDYKYWPLIKEYKEKGDAHLLKKIFIKGIELRSLK